MALVKTYPTSSLSQSSPVHHVLVGSSGLQKSYPSLCRVPETTGLLGKKRDTLQNGQKKTKKTKTSPNLDRILVSVASRLLTENFKKTGESFRGTSVQGCEVWKDRRSDPSILEVEVDKGKPRIINCFRCKSPWACVCCHKTIVDRYRSWLRASVIPVLEPMALSGSLITLTIQHKRNEDWSIAPDRLQKAFALVPPRMKKFYKSAGVVGSLRSLEATVGPNGLHGHYHIFLVHSSEADLEAFDEEFEAQYRKAVAEVGGYINENGYDFQPHCVNDYVAKFETAHEMSAADTKVAKLHGHTLAQLLQIAQRGGKAGLKAGEDWVRAQKALCGRRRFHAGRLGDSLTKLVHAHWQAEDLENAGKPLPEEMVIPSPSTWEDFERIEERIRIELEIAKLAESRAEPLPQPVVLTHPLADFRTACTDLKHYKKDGSISANSRPTKAIVLRAARTADNEKMSEAIEVLKAEALKTQEKRQALNLWPVHTWSALMEQAKTRRLLPTEVLIYQMATDFFKLPEDVQKKQIQASAKTWAKEEYAERRERLAVNQIIKTKAKEKADAHNARMFERDKKASVQAKEKLKAIVSLAVVLNGVSGACP